LLLRSWLTPPATGIEFRVCTLLPTANLPPFAGLLPQKVNEGNWILRFGTNFSYKVHFSAHLPTD
jgi:hypothetical protein